MRRFSVNKIAKITGGSFARRGIFGKGIRDITTDTRMIKSGSLFIALKGEKFDGHDFIADALSKGCSAVCISDISKLPGGKYWAIQTDNTLESYQKIAGAYRDTCDFKVIGVTGSVGKTSTREFIFSALSKELNVYRTRENFNNEIGLPKTLLETPEECDVSVVEMGMRAEGEIRELTLIAKPDIVAITNIGLTHIEYLGNKENILRAKSEIIEGLKPGGLVILNTDDLMLKKLCEDILPDYRVTSVYTGDTTVIDAHLSIRGFNIKSEYGHVVFDAEINSYDSLPITITDIFLPVPGTHNVLNALIGIAVAVELDVNLKSVVEGLAVYESVGNRLKIIECGPMTVIDDTYNAGPESMASAIEILADNANGRRKIAVLGGMLELGSHSEEAHIEIGREISDKSLDLVFAFTSEGNWYKQGANEIKSPAEPPQFFIFKNIEDMVDALLNELKDDDIVLIKGSRGFRMENITQAIIDRKISRSKSDI